MEKRKHFIDGRGLCPPLFLACRNDLSRNLVAGIFSLLLNAYIFVWCFYGEKMLWCFGNPCIFLGWKYDNLEFPFCERGTLFQLRPLGDHCSVALKRNFRGLRKGSPVQNMTNSFNKKSLSLSLLFARDRINSFVWKGLLHWNELKLLHDILWVSFIFSRRDRSETFLELWSRENKGNSFSIASISILSLPAHRERGETKKFFNVCGGKVLLMSKMD